MMYSFEALILEKNKYQILDNSYQKLLRRIQHLPQSTAIEAVYLQLEKIPLEGKQHIRLLTFFRNIISRENFVEREIVVRQLAVKDLSSKRWTSQIRMRLEKYNLPSA